MDAADATTSGASLDEYERRYMDPAERLLYREKVVSRTAFRVSIAMSVIFGVLGLVAIVAAPPVAALAYGLPSIALAALMGVLGVMFSVFRVMITSSHLHVHFGWAKRKIPMDAIRSVTAVRLQGLRQGKVKIGLDGVARTWVGNASSGRGVEITYQDGKRKHVLTIGSDRPEQFVETIERARRGESTGMRIAGEATQGEAAEDVAAEAEAAEAARAGSARR